MIQQEGFTTGSMRDVGRSIRGTARQRPQRLRLSTDLRRCSVVAVYLPSHLPFVKFDRLRREVGSIVRVEKFIVIV